MAKNDPEYVVAGAGLVAEVFTKLNRAIQRKNGPVDAFHYLSRPEGDPLVEQFADLLIAHIAPTAERYEEYTFEFDGDDPRWNTIDQKKYAWVGDITASDYPRTIKGKYRATVVLLPFDRNWSNRQGLQRIDDEHLLHMQRPIIETFGEKFPQVQQKAPVIGICGRPVRHRGELCVPHVSLREDGVDLGWRHVEGGWVRDCRLLAVRSIVAL